MQGGYDLGSGSGSGPGADPNANPNWRLQLQPDARSRIVNKIMDTLKRHLPVPEPNGLSELQKIAVRLEEKIYSAAISQPDYLRKISLKMLSMETKSPQVLNPALPNQEVSERTQLGFIDPNFTAMQGSSALCSGLGSGAGPDPNANADRRLQIQPDTRQRIVNKIMLTLKSHLPVQVPDALSELQKLAVRFEEKIYSAAISQPDYLRKVSLKMLSMETKTQPILNPALPNQEGVGMMSPQSGPYLGHSLAMPKSMNQPPASRQQQRQQTLIQGLPSTPSTVGGGASGATTLPMSGPSISNNNPMSVPDGTTISLPTDVHLNNQRRQPPQQLTPQNQMLYQQQLAICQELQKQQQQQTQMQMSSALAGGSGMMSAELTGGMQQQPAGQGGLIQQQQLMQQQQQHFMRQQQQQPQPTMQNPTIPIEQMNNVTELQQQHLQLQQNQMRQNQLQTHQMQFDDRIYSAASSQDASKRMRCRKNIVEKSRKCRICGDCSHKRRIPY